MPKTSPVANVTTQTTNTVQLKPALRKELLAELQTWEEGNKLCKTGEAKKKGATSNIDALMSEAGEFRALEEGITIDRFKAKMVFPTRTAWDENKLRKYLTPAQMEECKTTMPGTGYIKVTAGKEE